MPEAHDESIGQPPSWKTILYKMVTWGAFVLVVLFVGRALASQLRLLEWDKVQVNAPFAALAVLGTVVSKTVAFLPYGWLLGRFGGRPPWVRTMALIWTAQLGRYLPGKVGTMVGVVLLLRREGVAGQVAASTVLVTNGLAVILGAIIAVPLVLWEPIRSRVPAAWLVCVVATSVGLTCLHPRVFGPVANWVLRRLGRQPLSLLPCPRDYGLPALALAAQYALYGTAYWSMAHALAGVSASSIPVFIAIATMGVVAGLVAFFAPAGLGVQEGVFLLGLSQVMPKSEATLLIVVMRLMLTLVEVALAGVGLLTLRRTTDSREQPEA